MIKSVLDKKRDTIIEDWIDWILKHDDYKNRTREELRYTVSFAFDGVYLFICEDDTAKLDEFITMIAEMRLAQGFPLNAVQYAFEGFRVVATSHVIAAMRMPDLLDSFMLVYEAVNYAKNHFAEYYQQLTTSVVKKHMAELELVIEELKAERDRAELAVRLKDNFLSNVSHELRTPLTIIMGFAKLIWNGTSPPERMPELAKVIYTSGESLLRLVEEIIMMSRLASGEKEFFKNYVYVNELLKESVEETQKAYPGEAGRWVYDFVEPEPLLIGDHRKLQMMFFNILANAVKFSPPGSRIAIRTWVEQTTLHVDVTDEGIGVPQEDRGRIFEKFNQRESDLSRRYPGVGHGLFLAKMIANFHNGDIVHADNPAGRGSVFTITLPIRQREEK